MSGLTDPVSSCYLNNISPYDASRHLSMVSCSADVQCSWHASADRPGTYIAPEERSGSATRARRVRQLTPRARHMS